MKKIYIAIAVLAAAVLTSCQREQSFDDHVMAENEIAFVLQNKATRSAEVGSAVTQGINVKLGKIGTQNLFIEETITDLNNVAPATRGIPVYTENVGYLADFDLVVNAAGSDATYDKMDDEMFGGGWRYSHVYSTSIWPSETGKVDFYFRMPGNMTSNGVTVTGHSDGKTTFSYTSPTTAEGQQDIIFSHVKINKQEHKAALPEGYPVTFYHALTGIKFAIGNELTERSKYGIKVTSLSLVGLKNSGTCVINPAAETLADKVKWTALDGAATNAMTQAFTYGEGDSNDKYVKDYAAPGEGETDPNHFGSSFYTGGVDQNLNNDSASFTFWVIPQAFTSNANAKLRIDYEMNGVAEYMLVPLSVIAKKAWDAGQLRTFTFKLNDVNLKIEDAVTVPSSANQTNAYQGSIKNNVVITNTGNTDAFIRAAIVGQWWDNRNPESPSIVFGFRDEVNNLYLVESWYQDQFVDKTKNHGQFVGLAGYQDATKNTTGANPYNGWTLCTDGYYYYDTAIPYAGSPDVSDSNPCTTKALFDSYTLKMAPSAIDPITLAHMPAGSLYFTLEVATQAISANDPAKMDGTNFSDWKAAWQNADANHVAPVPVQ